MFTRIGAQFSTIFVLTLVIAGFLYLWRLAETIKVAFAGFLNGAGF